MGDHRAGTTGPTATAVTPSPVPAHLGGRRVARHAAERRPAAPYAGRRVAQVAPAPAPTPTPPPVSPTTDAPTYTGRRVAGRNAVAPVRPVAPIAPIADDLDDVSGHLWQPPTAPTLERYVGRRVARDLPLITEAAVAVAVVEAAPVLEEPVAEEPVAEEPVAEEPVVPELVDEPVLEVLPEIVPPVAEPAPVLVAPVPLAPIPPAEPVVAAEVAPPAFEALVVEPEPILDSEPQIADGPAAPRQTRPTGRRVASRRTRIPSLPLLAGVAVLAISTCGALQAVRPGLAGTGSDGHLSPASALSGSSAVGSANLLGGRGGVVSRGTARTALSSASGSSLQKAADAQAEQRVAVLSALRGRAEKRAAQIKLHQWVLPVTPGVYHLTARFGDYSSLWSHFHTGLDFAAPTGTPIMAVAGGTISEVGYSGAYGNRTIETLPDGTELWYCHQNEFGTSVGATVKPGQVIGYVGSTGNVTGPHLHLEVHPGGGDPVDPYTALIVHGLQP